MKTKFRFFSFRFFLAVALLFSFLQMPAPTLWAQSDADELFLVAQKAFDDGFYDVAIRYIEQFLQKYPAAEKRIQAQLLLGQCYFFQSQYLKAYDIFQSLLQFSEFQDATLFWLGETYFKGADYNQAEKQYLKAINVYPDSVYVPQAYYSLGWTYFEQGNYQKAKDTFGSLIQKFPEHALKEDAIFKFSECEYNLGNYPVAIDVFKNHIAAYPQSTRQAESYFYIAEAYYYGNDFLTAITYYAKAADIAYDKKLSLLSKISMGWCYLKLTKYDLALKSFAEAEEISLTQNIPSEDIYLGQATLYSETGENEKALAAYTTLAERFPNSPKLAEAWLGKANTNYILKNYPQAISEYQWIIDKYSQDLNRQEILEKAYYGLAWTHLKSGDIDGSIQSFESIMNKSENKIVKVSALTQIGDAYQDVNQLQKAIAVYDNILKDYPDSLYADYVQFRQGIALLKLNKIEAATLSFQTLQANFPESKYLTDVKYYLGVTYFKKEDWRQATNTIEEYLKSASPSDPFVTESRYVLAMSHFNLENYEKALREFEEIAKDYPKEKTMLRIAEFNTAKCLYHLGREKEAVKRIKAVVQNYPDTETAQDALLWLGDYAFRNADWDNAISSYTQLLNAFPGSNKINLVRYQLGQVFQATGEFDKALNFYRLVNDSSDKEITAKAKLAIADIFSRETDPQTAVDSYLAIANSSPDFQRDAYVKIARIYENSREYTKAIDAYQKALTAPQSLSEHGNAELQFSVGDIHEILKEKEKAVETYLKIPYLYPEEKSWIIKAYLRVARIFEDTEKWNEAKTTYDKVLQYRTEESKYAQERIDWINENISTKR